MASKANKRKKNSFGLFSVGIVTVLLLVVLLVQTSRARILETEKLNEYAAIEKAYEAEEKRSAALEERRIYVQTREFAEQTARERFGLVYDDETLVRIAP